MAVKTERERVAPPSESYCDEANAFYFCYGNTVQVATEFGTKYLALKLAGTCVCCTVLVCVFNFTAAAQGVGVLETYWWPV